MNKELIEKMEAISEEIMFDNQSGYYQQINVYKAAAEIAEKCAQVAEAHFNNHWIKCSERMPEKDGDYLCICGKNYFVLSLVGKSFYMDFSARSYFEDWTEYVTYWQPLPTPPKE